MGHATHIRLILEENKEEIKIAVDKLAVLHTKAVTNIRLETMGIQLIVVITLHHHTREKTRKNIATSVQ